MKICDTNKVSDNKIGDTLPSLKKNYMHELILYMGLVPHQLWGVNAIYLNIVVEFKEWNSKQLQIPRNSEILSFRKVNNEKLLALLLNKSFISKF